MNIENITFSRIYTKYKNRLIKAYNLANSQFDLSSPFGMIFIVILDLFQLNQVNITNASRVYDLNDPFNDNTRSIRSLARLAQYNPTRGTAASGSLRIQMKQNINSVDEADGNDIIFYDKMLLNNKKNNLEYTLNLNDESVTFSLLSNRPIILNIVQGVYKEISFTGTGELNQSFVIPYSNGKEIDQYDLRVYVNSELWTRKKHKFDLLEDEKAYVAYTSFSGGVDIIFGNGNEGRIPTIGAEIKVVYLVHDGSDGNILNYDLNDFEFIDSPVNEMNDDIDVDKIADIYLETDVNFGSNGDTAENLKQIIPYASPNFVLSGVEQYKFFLKRLKIFSLVDVFTVEKSDVEIKRDIYELCKKNIELLNKISKIDNNDSLKILIERNLKEIEYLRKMYINTGTENTINIFLVPDIKTYFGNDKKLNYFNVDMSVFTLSEIDKERILTYLYQDGIQTVSNEVRIIDPTIKKYVVNVTASLFESVSETNIINGITSKISDYFLYEMRRDKIPASDLVRILDNIDGIDSVTVEFVSEDNENYHKEYLIKSQQYFFTNRTEPKDSDIIMSDGDSYNPEKILGIDPLLGDIILEKDELPLIRGGFTDRYGNNYAIQPGISEYSPINILILPDRSKRHIN